ncbi:MAG TPA: inorganic pyrophosphatase, partial [Gammaproteobacteria bacterium]|nr:inorganic pyrophosphatase [Gammaproteobacteria bacterium]
EPGKWVKIDGWSGPDEARKEILSSQKRFSNSK